MSIFEEKNAKYVFKYYPGKGYRLCKLDSMGRIESYVNDYRDYAKILKEHPELKRTYITTDPKDLKSMRMALEVLKQHNYSHRMITELAMLMGTTVDGINKLIAQKEKISPSSINLDIGHQSMGGKMMENLSESDSKRKVEESGTYSQSTMPNYISLEERRKKVAKHKAKRKVKRCKCKK